MKNLSGEISRTPKTIAETIKDLGGLNVLDLKTCHQILRTAWIKAYYDSTNKADWKPLVGLIIESLTNTTVPDIHLHHPLYFNKNYFNNLLEHRHLIKLALNDRKYY
jgi:hypothetical protein